MKRLLSLSVCLMIAMLSLAHDFEVDGIYYNITSSSEPYTVEVTYKGTSYDEFSGEYTGDVIIPESITYDGKTYSVTSIGDYAFNSCSGLISITIPNSVTSIGYNTFARCSGLTIATIPHNVISIGGSAFNQCRGLTSIEIPSSVTSIGKGAFSNCSSLNSIVVSNGNTTYNSRENCNAIIETSTNTLIQGCNTTVIPNGVTNIDDWAFSGCSGLTSITIPNSVTRIGETAFNYCTGLTSVTIPNSVKRIGYCAFDHCSSLTSVSIPSDVTSIDVATFRNCSSLTSVTIPNNVRSIGQWAFIQCKSLTAVTIPNSVTSIAASAFEGCSSLESLAISNQVKSIGNAAFAECSNLTSVTIPNSLTSLGSGAFSRCSGLTSVTVDLSSPLTIGEWTFKDVKDATLYVPAGSKTAYENAEYWKDFKEIMEIEATPVPSTDFTFTTNGSEATITGYTGSRRELVIPEKVSKDDIEYLVTSIGDKAFLRNSNLTSVIIPNSVTAIEKHAFNQCSSLTSVTFPNSVTSIGERAFYDCSGLTSIAIPNSVIGIGEGAFSNCKNLTSIQVAEGNPIYDSRDNCNAIIETSTNTLIQGCNKTVIPNSVTNIGNSAFYGCSGLTSVTLGNNVTRIGDEAFSGCSGLTSVTIPNSVTSIGSSAFSRCKGLTSIYIPNSVTSIGSSAFWGCSSLTSVTIPYSVTNIGSTVFSDCDNLTSIVVSSDNPTYDSRDNCNAIIMTSTNSLIQGCNTTVIPNGVTKIGYRAFEGFSGLKSITIPSGVTTIGNYAFTSCNSLSSIIIPNSVTTIGAYAFSYCNSLAELTSNVPEPFATGANCWSGVDKSIPLYVKVGTKEKYQNTDGWKDFTNIIDNIPLSIGDILTAPTAEGVDMKFKIISETEVEVYSYSIDGSYSGSLTIPERVEGYKVTSIGERALYNYSDLTSVTIPNSVKSIGYEAFSGCSGLTSITIPNSVSSIGLGSFLNCSGLTSVNIPNSVTTIGNNAFRNCSGLTSVSIPNSVTSIGRSAFNYCSSLAEITSCIQEPLATLWCWIGVRNTIPLYVPAGTKEKYQSTDGWKDFTNIIEMHSVGDVFTAATAEGVNMKFKAIGETEVEVYSDGDTPSIDNTYSGSITIPDRVEGYNVTSIGKAAFQECTGLSYITIPKSVTSISENAFNGCSSLVEIISNIHEPFANGLNCWNGVNNSIPLYVPVGTKEKYQNTDGWKDFTNIIERIPYSIGDVFTATTAEGVEMKFTVKSETEVEVYLNAIDKNYAGSLTIPERVQGYNVTSIGNSAFSICSGLTSVSIPNSVTSIGSSAFWDCDGLTHVDIPTSVTNIGGGAFNGCSGLTSVTIPNNVTSIGSNVFGSCINLTSIVVSSSNPTYDSRDNCNAIIETSTNSLIQGCNSTIVPSSVTRIGENAFENCHSLISITIPNGVTSIGTGAFSGCDGLTSFSLPNTVTSIGESAFYCCSGLTSITIPNSVTSIGSGPFSGCSGLTSVTVSSGNTIYDSRDNCNAIIETATNQLISGCKSTIIPNTVKSIGSRAFSGCSGLTSVTIPNGVTSIGDWAFSGCFDLTSITIPESVTNIGNYAFSGCLFLAEITSYIQVPSATGLNCWRSVNKRIPLYVKVGSKEKYQNTDGWKDFTNIIDNIPLSIGDIITAPTAEGVDMKFKIISETEVEVYYGCIDNTYAGSITIPESVEGYKVTSIDNRAFINCSGLTSITIPSSVTKIGERIVEECTELTSIQVADGNPIYDSRDKCNAIIETATNQLISGCKSTVIPNTVRSIGEMAFSGCSSLTSIVIPNGVTSIGEGAFEGCYHLTSVTIPESVTSIDSWAFHMCWILKEITSYIKEPFTVSLSSWQYVSSSIPLYVPAGTKEKYQSTNGWKDFTNIIEFGGDVIEPTEEAKEVDMAAVPDQMDLNGMVVGDTYYALNKDNGDGADKEDGCVVINSITTEEAVSNIVGKEISDESVKDAFKGIIFMMPAGTGKVSVTGQTVGSSSLMVKVGSLPAQAFQLAERETVQIPYTVTEPTYVYIYAGTSVQGARAQGATTAAAAENSVKVYSYKWEPTEPTGINSIHNSQFTIENEAGAWYTLDGRKLGGKPAKKGVYIHNGRKVAIK